MSVNPVMNQSCWFHVCLVFHNALCNTTNPKQHSHKILSDFFWFSCQIHRIRFMLLSCRFQAYFHLCRIHVRSMPDSVEFNLAGLQIPFGCFDTALIRLCWIHADFSFTLNVRMICAILYMTIALRNTLHDNGVDLMPNSCWIRAEFKQIHENCTFFTTFATCREIPDYVSNNRRVILIILSNNIIQLNAWNATLLTHWNVFHGFRLNSARIRHEFSTSLISSIVQSIVKL